MLVRRRKTSTSGDVRDGRATSAMGGVGQRPQRAASNDVRIGRSPRRATATGDVDQRRTTFASGDIRVGRRSRRATSALGDVGPDYVRVRRRRRATFAWGDVRIGRRRRLATSASGGVGRHIRTHTPMIAIGENATRCISTICSTYSKSDLKLNYSLNTGKRW